MYYIFINAYWDMQYKVKWESSSNLFYIYIHFNDIFLKIGIELLKENLFWNLISCEYVIYDIIYLI